VKIFSPYRLIVLAIAIATGSAQAQTSPPGPSETITPPPALSWKFTASAPIVSSPIISDDAAFFGGLNSSFYAIDLHTGKLLWKLKTKGEIRSTASAKDGLIYFNAGDGLLRCLDASTGAVQWSFATGGERQHDFADYYQSSPVLYAGVIYFGSGDSCIYAVNARNGSLVWKFATGDVVHATPAVDSSGVYVGSFDGYFYALGRTTGTLIWKFKSIGHDYFPQGAFQGSATLGNGLIFVGARDFNFYALDQEKGYCHWNKAFVRGWALPTVLSDTVLYIGTSDDRILIAAQPLTGREYWKTNLHFNIFGGLAIADSVGFVGTLLGKIYGVNLRDGAVVWTFATDGYNRNHLKYFKPDDSFRDDIFEIVKSDEAFIEVEWEIGAIFSTPALSGRYLIVTSTDGQVYAFQR
jgi:eukaryotic-like serine/threonine-protein kinase